MRTILVIDDDEDARNLIAHILEPTKYSIIQAKNGIEGIRKSLVYHPDIITVDVMMPELNGIHMMHIFNMLRLQIPSIFVTIKTDIDKYIESFPSIEDVCLKSDLKTKLLPIVERIIRQTNRVFTDIQYSLKKKEVFGLLGKSDRKKILIITDNKTLKLIQSVFKELDLYELYFAPNGQEAVFKAVMTQPDLILCDIETPEIDGISLARILYILGHPFPLTFLSEKSDVNIIKKASKLEGIKGFLLKSEIFRNKNLLKERIESILKISDEDKQALRASYETIDMEKIQDFDMQSSIWASIAP